MKPIDTEEEYIKKLVFRDQLRYEGIEENSSEEEEYELLETVIKKYEWERWPGLLKKNGNVLMEIDGIYEEMVRMKRELGLYHLLGSDDEDIV